MNEYVLTEVIFKRLSKRYGRLICCYCGKPLKKGDEVISFQRTTGHNSCKRYHKECYAKTFIDG